MIRGPTGVEFAAELGNIDLCTDSFEKAISSWMKSLATFLT